MTTLTSGKFLSYAEWFQNVITENVILCNTSSLEMQDMFNGTADEKEIEVYALEKGRYENIRYHLVDSFISFNVSVIHGIRCTTFEQTVNDMLRDISNTDIWALTEALSNYYYSHNSSFSNLHIASENLQAFESIKEDAINYYNEG